MNSFIRAPRSRSTKRRCCNWRFWPWADGFVTAGSIVGTILLGRKFIENWPLWLIVNAASIGLFVYKGLHLTVALYVIFFLLAIWGWIGWTKRLKAW